MNLEDFKLKVKENPNAVAFKETIKVIEANYEFTPTPFSNGNVENNAGENSGSCKIFAFAVEQALSKKETLACFGDYYFNEVLNNPDGDGHQNIRNFMETGFQGLDFKGMPLQEKEN